MIRNSIIVGFTSVLVFLTHDFLALALNWAGVSF
jgi:hypothetical protein